jgi:hypothetical protein
MRTRVCSFSAFKRPARLGCAYDQRCGAAQLGPCLASRADDTQGRGVSSGCAGGSSGPAVVSAGLSAGHNTCPSFLNLVPRPRQPDPRRLFFGGRLVLEDPAVPAELDAVAPGGPALAKAVLMDNLVPELAGQGAVFRPGVAALAPLVDGPSPMLVDISAPHAPSSLRPQTDLFIAARGDGQPPSGVSLGGSTRKHYYPLGAPSSVGGSQS